ncbi:RNA polymerase sporulation sigma factor SigF [Mahella sp.]|uniref:RNA polymerase sporulation sigma factor SigF n=1 Tax=Mahella sp. TaxID=2798721 RepID=UPI0025BA18A5|nr:RNA polymerase sporulation sigma factor SigF [Mahella sp.]MBZ4665572.1 polymerase, sigma 28 subunit, SigF [Mahella sp.]
MAEPTTTPADDKNRGLLTQQEIEGLIVEARKGNKQAAEILAERNLGLVHNVVRKFMNRGYEYDDLFQVGSMGLVKAINNYDLSYNVKFSTYAVPMIMGEIKRFLRDDGSIKVSRSVKIAAYKIHSAQDRIKKELGREPSVQELATALDMEPADVVYAMEADTVPVSLYDNAYEDGESSISLIDRISDDDELDTDVIDKVALKECIAQLDAKGRQVILLRYFKDKTQSEVAQMLGITQVQVCRIEKKVLEFMRQYIK